MPDRAATVAIPVLNGGRMLDEVLTAVRAQEIEAAPQLLICDSGSTDGSRERAVAHGADVLRIDRSAFSHGGTRNLLVERADGEHVVFLTQDAAPADEHWLRRMLDGFRLADDVGLVFGPYRPRADASPPVARELDEFFAAMAPDGRPVIDRAGADESWRALAARATFFTSANGAIAKAAWLEVPVPEVPYAEDRLLARRMLERGYAKVYVPSAAVVHSHDYTPVDQFRRYFDEFRGLRETFGHVESASPRRTLGILRREVAADRAWCAARGMSGPHLREATIRSLRHHATRAAGAQLGSRADRLPPSLRRRWSLERRATFQSVEDAR